MPVCMFIMHGYMAHQRCKHGLGKRTSYVVGGHMTRQRYSSALRQVDIVLMVQGDNVLVVVLQVHDELLFEVKSSMLQHACIIIKQCMENAVSLSVPFPVKLRVGPSWGELEPYHLQL